MRKLFLLAFVFSGPIFAANVTCNPIQPISADNCTALPGDTVTITWSKPASDVKLYGHSVGSVSGSGATSTYQAPAKLVPANAVAGVQMGPNDSIWYTKIDKLPELSFAKQTVKGGQWNYYTMLGPVGSNIPGSGGAQGVTMNSNKLTVGGTEYVTLLDGTEPMTWSIKNFYDDQPKAVSFPDPRNSWKLRREGGDDRIDIADDYHTWMVRPKDGTNWEIYNDTLNNSQACHFFKSPNAAGQAYLGCTAGSSRASSWFTYAQTGGINAAGTPLGPLEWHLSEILAGKITHAAPFTTSNGYICGSIWPASGAHCGAPNAAPYGTRWRLSKNIHFLTGGEPTATPIAVSINVTNAGSGYIPGSQIKFTIAGCTGNAKGVAQIAQNGTISNNNGWYAWVTDSGTNCTNPTVTFDPPNGTAGGAPATGTVNTIVPSTKFKYPKVATTLLAGMQDYGWIVTDIGSSNMIAVDPATYLDETVSTTYSQLLGSGGFITPLMFEAVDEIGYNSGGRHSTNDLRAPWDKGTGPTNATTNPGAKGNEVTGSLWQSDSRNRLEGDSVPNQAIVLASMKGKPVVAIIALEGTAVSVQQTPLNVLSGMMPYKIPVQVTGDRSNAGFTCAFEADPDPGKDSLDAVGCKFKASTTSVLKQGQIKISAKANPAAFDTLAVNVIPTVNSPVPDSVAYDVGGKGGSDGTKMWLGDCCGEVATINSGNDPVWKLAKFAIAEEEPIYRTSVYTYGDDLRYNFVAPNGNYRIRFLMGNPYTNTNNYAKPATNPTQHAFNSFLTQDSWKMRAYFRDGAVNNTRGIPVDVTVPAKVTDNLLHIVYGGYFPFVATGSSPWACSQQGNCSAAQSPLLTGFMVMPDKTTAPHWELGNYKPAMDGLPDERGGVIRPTTDAFAPGDAKTIGTSCSGSGDHSLCRLQFYVEDWYTGVHDPSYKLMSGPGAITPAGLYTAPTTPPSGDGCALIQAQSLSKPSVKATTKLCVTAAANEAPPKPKEH